MTQASAIATANDDSTYTQRTAYFNGQYIKECEATISIYDRGFLYGDAAYDVARTYAHKPFQYEDHIDRLYRSLRYLRIDPQMSPQEMLDISNEVTAQNMKLLSPSDDFRMVWRITRGDGVKAPTPDGTPHEPTVLIHNDPVRWKSMAHNYVHGGHLLTSRIRVDDPQSIDVKAKLHSKLAHALADVEAQEKEPGAIALMLDQRGCVAEASRANIFVVDRGRLLTPKRRTILPGISRATVMQLAQNLGIEVVEDDLDVSDVYNTQEIFLTAASPFIEPISMIDGLEVPGPYPGPITKQIISAFSELAGVDFVQQAIANAGKS
ncbi:MAG: branched-chain amino acid aminotransferase [Chloroflexi bacterium]|jgi:branched-chain amino acid aminotransferase|nr:MAG: branched-chain amino acid aminotransferase [Chloroflexota bacterium]